MRAEVLHFLGEVEVVFGLWAVLLHGRRFRAYAGWAAASTMSATTVNYTEPLFVVVIMALASTRPIIGFAEAALRRVAAAGGGTPAAWWVADPHHRAGAGLVHHRARGDDHLRAAPRTAVLRLQPSTRLKYATLGVLFVNVSIGGTLTHFAAPPVLMVARPVGMGHPVHGDEFRLARAARHRRVHGGLFLLVPARAARPRGRGADGGGRTARTGRGSRCCPCRHGSSACTWRSWPGPCSPRTTPRSSSAAFLFFLGFARATAPYQSRIELKTPLLVGFFLAGLVIHGGLQGWWIAPVLSRLSESPLFLGATGLTAVNDNALITYLATLVPNLRRFVEARGGAGRGRRRRPDRHRQRAESCRTGAAGRFFDGAILPIGLLAALPLPTLIAAAIFRLL